MKIPAIRAKMGNWTYYISTLTFEQVNNHIEKVDDQLHKSTSLKDMIQRSITKNFENIKAYILHQDERFFNSLVLAVYNDSPKWIEVELNYDGEEFFSLGLLDFPGDEKIFPVDGQHRVEGIKAALNENPELKSEKIGAIFIGHSTDEVGMRKTRRLFTTLNRYAKPVTMDDIIALDEDDSVAITTRELLENQKLFSSNRVTKSKNKAISENDKTSITSIITLYQCNRELLKLFRLKRKVADRNPERDKKGLEEYLKFRPKEIEIQLYGQFVSNFWDDFINEIDEIRDYNDSILEKPALPYRNKETGGNLLFRPVGLLPFVQSCIEIHKRKNITFVQILKEFNKIDFTISEIPWKNIFWNQHEKTMIMNTGGIAKLLLIYMFDDAIKPHELRSLKEKYADKTNFYGDDVESVLDEVPRLG